MFSVLTFHENSVNALGVSQFGQLLLVTHQSLLSTESAAPAAAEAETQQSQGNKGLFVSSLMALEGAVFCKQDSLCVRAHILI